ncbi:YslB family protein [Halalkalibacter okhensis]|uniref:DUF2507 domain-containing protein n=1 Tax=Halalkalibacter okhensis TaxID=333138 RepID=A0A0B0IJE5_9BACI|nr:YslB family protein [Halalkalibacter okhensis]KHF41002.1 hypothetical protein LQ50_06340 [Halalkalibacter okhensis]
MDVQSTQFGYDLIRNDILKDLLGKDHDGILYWIGKSLARKYPLSTVEDAILFFEKANWGSLSQIKEKKQVQVFELKGAWMNNDDGRCYQLEAGFLAQQVEMWLECISGATYTKSKNHVLITVETDKRDSIEEKR